MNLPAGLTSKFGKQILTLQKNAPQLLFAGGITAGVTSTVLACKATLKLKTTLSQAKGELADVRAARDLVKSGEQLTGSDGQVVDYDEKTASRDIAVIYTQSIIKLIRLYGPAIGTGALAIALLTKSQHILHERNAGLAAAYAALDKAFGQYRERVVGELGAEKDQEFRHGVEEYEEINPETGRKRKVRGAAGESLYAKFFDETNPNFERDPDLNLIFLSQNQAHCQNLLQARGYLFLNEVYNLLGIPATRAGAVVGWLKGEGDDFVDFGLYDGARQTQRDFINGREGAILLDFNVDGEMWNRIPESGETTWLS